MRKMKKFIHRFIVVSLSLLVFLVLVVFSINVYMVEYTKDFIYDSVSALPECYTVIVPGAKVYANNVSNVVRDRIDAAAVCIREGKCQRILISGDHGQADYDEVNQMRKYMQRVYGIDGGLIFMDHAGFSTYETMYRARDIFCVHDAVVVTQEFHVARAVYIARKLGLDAVAYKAPELTPFTKATHLSWTVRESLARVKSFFLVLFNASPTYLGNEIPIIGDSKNSWDSL